MQKILFIVLCLACIAPLHAQEPAVSDTTDNTFVEKAAVLVEDVIDLVTIEKGRSTISLYPMAGYSPRTGFEIGVMPVWRIKPKNIDENRFYRPTTIAPSITIATKGMYEVEFDVLAFTSNRWMFISKFQYLYLPDEFYGIGNQQKEPPFSQFDINRFAFSSDVLKGINDSWFIGLRFDINYDEFSNFEGDLLNPSVLGYAGGWVNGIGPGMAFDNRDDQLYPTKGWFVIFSAAAYDSFMGSDYQFGSASLDARKFISLNEDKSILGFQAVVNARVGDVPFYKLSSIGGKRMLRGIAHPYRYMDKHSWFAQAEWRRHIWWRIGAVAFAGTGKVSPDFFQSPFSDLHVVAGAGARFKVLPDEGLNFRIDFGISNHGDNGVYFTIREAF
ncbi:BamA/TamA family outer membrane protein [Carboxylicivirga sp. M1479]|uniref:BamA/TamA family outer membrane protein n=1 Tax=Carboxylicivirga sp. M1479 TaxID=2594476 RepID=UPI001177DEA7|nr:BamA/TamA family outer membrane protein [Carboxylicivirga sp. M1479]TRX65977.1 BamA/TamA family outer membrane protein [Carboxylicivirga sp. M1479]